MYASVINFQFKPGKTDEATAMAAAMSPELESVPGIRQFLVIDQGDDNGLAVVVYNSQADQEAATPKARELLGNMAELYAAPPERKGGEVTVNESF